MIIDANVFKGFFQMQMNKAHCLCGCPQSLVNSASVANPMFHDRGGRIEQEWRDVVDRDWFDAWLASSLQDGIIQYAAPRKDTSIESKLLTFGFPRSRDFVYVWLTVAVSAAQASCELFTEDLDFYDPKKKGCPAKTRKQLLTTSGGPVPKLLKKHNIFVRCVP